MGVSSADIYRLFFFVYTVVQQMWKAVYVRGLQYVRPSARTSARMDAAHLHRRRTFGTIEEPLLRLYRQLHLFLGHLIIMFDICRFC